MRRAIALHPYRYAGGRLRVILDAPQVFGSFCRVACGCLDKLGMTHWGLA